MLTSHTDDLSGITHDILQERFTQQPKSINEFMEKCKVAYDNATRKLVGYAISTSALLAAKALLTQYAGAGGQAPAPNFGGGPAPPGGMIIAFAAAAAAAAGAVGALATSIMNSIRFNFTKFSIAAALTYFGEEWILAQLEKSRKAVCAAFDSRRTKQMVFIAVINQTDYGFKLTDSYDMIGYESSRFEELFPVERVENGSFASWGVWATGSGDFAGAASAIQVTTNYCPPGGSDFYFIASGSCPAWTSTNTIALKLGSGKVEDHNDVVKECKDNESVSSHEYTQIERQTSDSKVRITANLENNGGKRCFMVVRITETAVQPA